MFKVSGNNNFQPLDRSHRALPLNVSRNGFDTLKALNARNDSIVPSAATTFAPAGISFFLSFFRFTLHLQHHNGNFDFHWCLLY